MDLKTMNMSTHADRGAVLNVRHPATRDEMHGVTITLRGTDSTVYHNRLLELRRKIVQQKTASIETANSDYDDARVELVISWTGIAWEGKELECTPENVKMIFGTRGFEWLTEQVDGFVSRRANFFPNAGTN